MNPFTFCFAWERQEVPLPRASAQSTKNGDGERDKRKPMPIPVNGRGKRPPVAAKNPHSAEGVEDNGNGAGDTILGHRYSLLRNIHQAEARYPTFKPNATGRPTKYQADYPRWARAFCMLRATDNDLAQCFNVSLGTIIRWLKDEPEFRAAVDEGRHVADARVVEALYDRAIGYTIPFENVIVINSKVRKIITHRHIPPDLRAIKFWLMNRRPDLFKEQYKLEHTGAGGGPIQTESKSLHVNLSVEELRTLQGALVKIKQDETEDINSGETE
jgi:hypothetical protein